MSFQNLLPDLDARVNNWLHQGAGSTNLYDSINDPVGTPDDNTTYIAAQGPWPGDYYWAHFGAVTVASNQRIRGVRIKTRVAAHTSGVGEGLYVTIRDPNISTALPPRDEMQYASTSWKTHIGTYRPQKPGGGEWTKTILDRCQLELFSKGASGGLKVTQCYVEAEVVNRPTVTGVTASGITTTSRPTIAWDWTQADDYPVYAYEVKLFNANQYNAAGFNPATVVPILQSGYQRAGGTVVESWVAGQPLPNGTYKAYVRASMEFLGTDWWSDWGISSAFTQGIVAPPTPTLVITQDATLPRLRNLCQGTHPVNLLTENQGDLEVDAAGWAGGSSTTADRSTTQFLAPGVASLRLTRTGTTGDATATTPTGLSGISIKPNTQVTGIGSSRAGSTLRSSDLALFWYKADGTASSTPSNTGSAANNATGSWTAYTVTATSPNDAAFVALRPRNIAAVATEIHYWDKMSVHVGATTVFTTGGYKDFADGLIEFADVTVGDYNYCVDQIASAGGIARTADGFFPRVADRVTYDPTDQPAGLSGQGCILWETLVGAGGFLDIGDNTTADPEQLSPTWLIPIVATVPVRIMLYVKVSANITVRVSAQPVDEHNTAVGSAVFSGTSALTAAGGWQRLALNVTPGAGSSYLRPGIENNSSTTGVQVRVAKVQVAPGTVDIPWHPGQGRVAAWLPVRGGDGTTPLDNGQQVRIYDEEVPTGGRIRHYRAHTYADTAGGQDSPPSTVIGTRMDGAALENPTRWLFKDPFDPESSFVAFVTEATEARPVDKGVSHPLGRNQAVGFVDFVGKVDRSLQVILQGEEEYERFLRLMDSSTILWAVPPEGGGSYLAFGSPTWPRGGPFSRIQRVVTMQGEDVARPG